MAGTVFSALCVAPLKGGAVITPFLQIRKMVLGKKLTCLRSGSQEVVEPGIQDEMLDFRFWGMKHTEQSFVDDLPN